MVADWIERFAEAASSSFSRRALLAVAVADLLVATTSAEAKQDKPKERDKDNRRKSKPKPKQKRKRKQKHEKKPRSGKSSSGGCTNRYSEQEVLGFIKKAAKKYNQSAQAMERVARCESNLDPCAVNRSGPYYGLFQFLKSTWKTTPYGNRDIFDPEAQALATAWMWNEGRKNEWACQ